jgi:hypothetical protein
MKDFERLWTIMNEIMNENEWLWTIMNDNEWNYEWNYEWKWMKMPNERSRTFAKKPLWKTEVVLLVFSPSLFTKPLLSLTITWSQLKSLSVEVYKEYSSVLSCYFLQNIFRNPLSFRLSNFLKLNINYWINSNNSNNPFVLFKTWYLYDEYYI